MKKSLITKKKNQNGFTLVELIVVVAIIGVLVAMMVPSLIGYVNKAKIQKNNSNARTIASTVQASNAPLEVPIKEEIVYDGGDWKYTDTAKTLIDAFNTDLKQMITVDGGARVAIDGTGKVIKVVYTTKDEVPNDASIATETIGIWTQTTP